MFPYSTHTKGLMTSKLIQWTTAACVAVMLVTAVAPARAGASDAWVSTKVKMQLMNSPQVSGFPIDVDTDGGRVTLSGRVPTRAQQAEAGRIARAATGVVSVRNLLQVVPASARKRVAVADERVRVNVNAALAAEPALTGSSVEAHSVTKGVVLLSGKTSTLSNHLLALEIASAVPGVRRVASEIESPDEFGDREVWNDGAMAEPSHGNVVTDGWITAQTKMQFMTDKDIRARDIHVDTRRGVVTLFGTVPTSAVSEKAFRVAKDVAGVRSVTSELRVVPASQRQEALALDGTTETAVRTRLGEAKMEGSAVTVEVRAGTARLSGTVRHASHRYAAVSIAHATPGVDRVQDDLRIEPAKPAAE
jgi:osmotically-inducible protein OsmY